MSGVQKYDQEKQLESTFEEIKAGFKKYDGLGNGDKQTVLLKELTNKMQECKKCAANTALAHIVSVAIIPSSNTQKPQEACSYA